MGGTALIAFGASGTFAAFSDSATLSNRAGAGTLILEAGNPTKTAPIEAENLNPGDEARYAYFVQNDGNLAGQLTAQFNLIRTDENGCSDLEKQWDGSCTGDNAGEFAANATINAYYLPAANEPSKCNIQDATAQNLVREMPFNAATVTPINDVPVPAGAYACVVLGVELDESATNAVQSDTATFDAVFTLEQ